jgi:hypothetical protein
MSNPNRGGILHQIRSSMGEIESFLTLGGHVKTRGSSEGFCKVFPKYFD